MIRSTSREYREHRLTRRGIALAGVIGLIGAPAAAQEYEWEPVEGWHEEEWYDPSDWFDDEPYDSHIGYSIDYENRAPRYEAYWDGYYDGYLDDEYGADYWDNDWSAPYKSAYTDGYYDGYYDTVRGYEFGPSYYVFAWSEGGDEDTKRARDKTRTRGDRAETKDESASDSQKAAAKEAVNRTRVRGTVSKIEQFDKTEHDDHVVLRLTFENEKSVVADFGPKRTREKMPITKGERVTVTGDKKKRNGREVIVVRRITDEGKTYTIRGDRVKEM